LGAGSRQHGEETHMGDSGGTDKVGRVLRQVVSEGWATADPDLVDQFRTTAKELAELVLTDGGVSAALRELARELLDVDREMG
jgi:molybdopterin biosynthesis enzyme